MTLQRKYRIISLIMAVMVFCSSSGFSLDLHYCQGQLKSFSILGKAKNCHEMANMSHCKHHGPTTTSICSDNEDKNCCNNETLLVKSDLELQVNSFKLNLDKNEEWFITAFASIFLYNYSIEYNETELFQIHRPPLIPRDICVLFQNFLL